MVRSPVVVEIDKIRVKGSLECLATERILGSSFFQKPELDASSRPMVADMGVEPIPRWL